MPRTSDKRDRLIAAAKQLIHHRGYRQTTLAEIAEASGVPHGNVYYYFRAKDELGAAVIEERRRDFLARTEQWAELADPRRRLQALVAMMHERRDLLSRYGCPVGSLAQELDKDADPLSDHADSLLELYIRWASEQFRALAVEDSRDCAEELIANMQGAILIASAQGEPGPIERASRRLNRWLETLPSRPQPLRS